MTTPTKHTSKEGVTNLKVEVRLTKFSLENLIILLRPSENFGFYHWIHATGWSSHPHACLHQLKQVETCALGTVYLCAPLLCVCVGVYLEWCH